MCKEATTCKVYRTSLRDNASFDLAPRPECVSHGAPRLLRVCAVVAGSVFANDEARSLFCDFEIDDALHVCRALDVVAFAIRRQIDRAALGVETELFCIEAVVFQRIR